MSGIGVVHTTLILDIKHVPRAIQCMAPLSRGGYIVGVLEGEKDWRICLINRLRLDS